MITEFRNEKGQAMLRFDIQPRILAPELQHWQRQMTVIIPCALKSMAISRKNNLDYTVRSLLDWGFTDIIVSAQKLRFGESLPTWFDEDPRVRVIWPEVGRERESWKTRLVNTAADQTKRKFIVQLDMDIMIDWELTLKEFADMDDKEDTCITPYAYFRHLTEEQSEKIKSDGRLTCMTHSPSRIYTFIAGCWIMPTARFQKIRYDEFFRGWGREDNDLTMRVKEEGLIRRTFENLIGMHLWHHQDRVIRHSMLTQYEVAYSSNRPRQQFAHIKTIANTCQKTKYIILAAGRCGTNLFARSLNKHDEIYSFHGEAMGYGVFTDWTADHIITTPLEELYEYLLGTLLVTSKPITGWRVLFSQPYKNDYRWPFSHEGLQQEIHKWTDTKIIHIYRENMVDWALSWELARRFGWIYTEYKPEHHRYTHPSPENLLRLCQQYARKTNAVHRRFKDHPGGYHMLSLEQMTSDWEGAMGRTQEFLGAENIVTLPQCTNEQRTKGMGEFVPNFPEIMRLAEQIPDLKGLPFGQNVVKSKHSISGGVYVGP